MKMVFFNKPKFFAFHLCRSVLLFSCFVQLLAIPPPEDAQEAIGKTVLPQDWSSGTDHV